MKQFVDLENRFNKLVKSTETKIRDDVNLYNKRSENRYLSLEEKLTASIEEITSKINDLDIER